MANRGGIPDVRDGLTRVERVVLWQLHLLQKERGGRFVPSALLYGRVVEHVDITPEELQETLARLGARRPLVAFRASHFETRAVHTPTSL